MSSTLFKEAQEKTRQIDQVLSNEEVSSIYIIIIHRKDKNHRFERDKYQQANTVVSQATRVITDTVDDVSNKQTTQINAHLLKLTRSTHISTTASAPSFTELKLTLATAVCSGTQCSFKVASVTIPSVPSLPMNNLTQYNKIKAQKHTQW